MGIEYGGGPNYAPFNDATIYHPEFTLKPGQRYKLRATKEVIGNTVRIRMYAGTTMIGEVTDTGQLHNGTPFIKRMGSPCDLPVDQVRIDNWTVQKDATPQYCHGVSSMPFHG